jgi:hypothetical protein
MNARHSYRTFTRGSHNFANFQNELIMNELSVLSAKWGLFGGGAAKQEGPSFFYLLVKAFGPPQGLPWDNRFCHTHRVCGGIIASPFVLSIRISLYVLGGSANDRIFLMAKAVIPG